MKPGPSDPKGKASKAKTAKANVAAEEALRLESRPSPKLVQMISAVVSTVTATLVIAAVTVPLEQVVNVPGKLVTRRSTQEIKAPDAGIVSQVLVQEGQQVRQGDVLLSFDPEVNSSRVTEISQQLKSELSRLESEQQRLAERIGGLERQLVIDQRILEPLQNLASSGGISALQVAEKERVLENTRTALAESRSELDRTRHESRKLQSQLRFSLLEAKDMLSKIELKAPANGTVLALKALTAQVVPANETLLKIVPSDDLEAKVFAPSRDLAFIRPQQQAKIHLTAYDSSLYGTINATVSVIAEDALPPSPETDYPHFPISLVLESQVLRSRGRTFALQPGMSLNAKIKLQKRTFAQLLFSRLSRGLDAVRQVR
jgi:multidrug efflux pump subunit AcrA (membrane-fusion protein)